MHDSPSSFGTTQTLAAHTLPMQQSDVDVHASPAFAFPAHWPPHFSAMHATPSQHGVPAPHASPSPAHAPDEQVPLTQPPLQQDPESVPHDSPASKHGGG
jgi:hypothetical protein